MSFGDDSTALILLDAGANVNTQGKVSEKTERGAYTEISFGERVVGL